jgi:hypothetical protein
VIDPSIFNTAYLASTDGSSVEPLPPPLSFVAPPYPDISLDGQRTVYLASGGCDQPCIETDQLWLYEPDVELGTQLTEGASAYVRWPRLSGDGQYVYYYLPQGLHRHEIATGELEYAAGLRDARVPSTATIVAVDEVGRAVYADRSNPTGGNPDLSRELWLVDFDATPTFDIAKGAPAEIRFSPDPRGQAYDVIRGDLANLHAADDDTVDLGPVVCLADDVASSVAVDPGTPAASQGFFYLFRWSDDWGTSSSGAPRMVSTGDCNP